MSYKIVVSRYKENVEWLRNIDNVLLYNKDDIEMKFKEEIMLKENIGRESYVYLKYIIDNYNNLPDIVCFIQANISDHMNNNDEKILIKMINDANNYGFSLLNIIVNINDNDPDWGKEWNKNYRNTGKWFLEENYKDNKHKTFKEWFEENIDDNYPSKLLIHVAALIAVKKELILSRSKEYYKKLIQEVSYHNHPIEAHFLERSWHYIFNCPTMYE